MNVSFSRFQLYYYSDPEFRKEDKREKRETMLTIDTRGAAGGVNGGGGGGSGGGSGGGAADNDNDADFDEQQAPLLEKAVQTK